MKQLTCEMCGSTDLLKQDGVFVCQSCGCKYSIEEAKKMMVEGTVDVSGSEVKIDSSKQLENLRTLAEQARKMNDTESAAKYYEQIRLEEPNDWEANFYSVLYSASNCKIAQIGQAALRVGNALDTIFALIADQYSDAEKTAQENETEDTEDDISNFLANSLMEAQTEAAYARVCAETTGFLAMLTANAADHIGDAPSFDITKQRIDDWFVPIAQANILLGDGLIRHFNAFKLAQTAYNMCKSAASSLSYTQRGKETIKIINSRLTQLNELKSAKAREEAEKYWEEHAEEKAALEQEKSSLHQQLKELNARSIAIPERKTADELQSKIDALEAERSALGLFKIKERQALQAQIDGLDAELSGLQARVREAEAEIQEKGDLLRVRIREIDSTLSSIPE